MKKELNGNVVCLPDTKGWAKKYIDTEIPIPEKWRDKFYDELVSDDEQYKNDLNESIRKHGVRWN